MYARSHNICSFPHATAHDTQHGLHTPCLKLSTEQRAGILSADQADGDRFGNRTAMRRFAMNYPMSRMVWDVYIMVLLCSGALARRVIYPLHHGMLRLMAFVPPSVCSDLLTRITTSVVPCIRCDVANVSLNTRQPSRARVARVRAQGVRVLGSQPLGP